MNDPDYVPNVKFIDIGGTVRDAARYRFIRKEFAATFIPPRTAEEFDVCVDEEMEKEKCSTRP